ncbi:MAG: quinone-dependent dihydroorotate dehydrogenase [Elusimicrobia bacterium]|nr:quinone-dependent dihydroorotate dehydrogenase [Elusimicrobiota bacterium]
MLYESLVRPALFRSDPETAHDAVVRLLSFLQSAPLGPRLVSWTAGSGTPGLETEVLGLRFPNPVGLAAGYDKDCRLAGILPSLGFGFLELGSITLRPQPGNPKPRLFRVVEARAIINRMGFNGDGAAEARSRLKALGKLPLPVGINLGLNKDCPHERAPQEYAETFRLLEPFGDYFAVNVSSPNTPGLRALQDKLQLERILRALGDANRTNKPLLVKISPDMEDSHLQDLAPLIASAASGMIVSNTTLSRDGVPDSFAGTQGGLSGSPLAVRSTRLVARVFELTQGRLPIIGVGGIFTGADAYAKIRAGASLVQVYTGLVYRGPTSVRRIQAELAECLKRDGYKTVREAVGKGSSQ